MKKFLKVIATPFVALWRWIKETAWVQPLLIVGIIFAIIFSIPYISSGISDWINSTDDDIDYLDDYQLSMEGSKQVEGYENSEVNVFFDRFVEAQEAWINGNKDEAKTILKDYGSEGKFFLFFVQEDCSGCSTLKEGLEYLTDNFSLVAESNGEETEALSWRSILVDEEIDDDYYDDEDKAPFEDILAYKSYLQFYRICATMCVQQNYYLNLDSSKQETLYDNVEAMNDFDSFQTPTIVLFDLTETNQTQYIIKSIFFELYDKYSSYSSYTAEGATSAYILADCWKAKNMWEKNYFKVS